MNKIFFTYRSVIINCILFVSLIMAMFLHGNKREFFIGFSTGIVLVIFGKSIALAKTGNQSQPVKMTNEN